MATAADQTYYFKHVLTRDAAYRAVFARPHLRELADSLPEVTCGAGRANRYAAGWRDRG